jgi:hypothetical protein
MNLDSGESSLTESRHDTYVSQDTDNRACMVLITSV